MEISGFLIEKTGFYISGIILFFLLVNFFLLIKFYPSFVVPSNIINKWKFFLERLLIAVLIFLILLVPFDVSWIESKVLEKKKTLNVQILYDVSLSMTADDIQPSRFNAAKKSVISLVKNLEWYNISMIAYSWLPFIWTPFTDATDALVSKLKDMEMWDFPPDIDFVWTAIWDSIILGIDNLEKISENKERPGIIILITDWDSNKGSDPIQAASLAASKNIPVYTLGIGKSDYVIWTDQYGWTVKTNINLQLLRNISETSWWKFYRVLSKQDFKDIFDEISNYVKSQEKVKVNYEYWYLNNYIYPIIVILILIYSLIRLYSYRFRY